MVGPWEWTAGWPAVHRTQGFTPECSAWTTRTRSAGLDSWFARKGSSARRTAGGAQCPLAHSRTLTNTLPRCALRSTLAMIKPDAYRHMGKIIDAICQSGFHIRCVGRGPAAVYTGSFLVLDWPGGQPIVVIHILPAHRAL